jgi:hypothetical protein
MVWEGLGPEVELTEEVWTVPFSRMVLMTSSTTCVPNSLSSVESEAAPNLPWTPCLYHEALR